MASKDFQKHPLRPPLEIKDSPAPIPARVARVLPRSFGAGQAKPKDYRIEIPLELLCTDGAAGARLIVLSPKRNVAVMRTQPIAR
jgi:hypothetical protein